MKKHGNNSENPGWSITYHPAVVKIDIPRIGKAESIRVKGAIEYKLSTNPVIYGIPLRATLKHYWKLRVGDWRIVFSIIGHEVRIYCIAHRRDVYKIVTTRS